MGNEDEKLDSVGEAKVLAVDQYRTRMTVDLAELVLVYTEQDNRRVFGFINKVLTAI